jgi:uncharacterized cupredoxin-like copper-binding protein
MRRLFIGGLMINLAILLIGVTWIGPIQASRNRAEAAARAPVTRPTAAPAVARAAVAPTGPVAVSLDQWSITPQTSTVAAGPVTFDVSNDGSITHEFVVMRTDTPAADFHIGSFEGEKPRVNEDTVGTNVGETGDMEAATTKSVTIDLKPGHYVFMCNLPAHYGLGMHTDFTVSAASAPAERATTAPAASAAAGGSLTVALDQWSITPQAATAAAGPVTFDVSNDGTMTHEFVVMRTDTPAADFHIGSFEGEKPRVNEDTVGTNVGETGDMVAGAIKSITIDLKPGHYVFMCNLPAHYGLGMHTDFTVT